MALKDELLRFFCANPQESFSGEQLAKQYGVSRAGIWKAVQALRSDGFEIISDPSGYTFTDANDFLSEEAIRACDPSIDTPVHVFETIDSTNNYAKILAAQNAPHGTIVIANHQTAGRGRQGHSFYSPKNTGLYFSILIHPEHTGLISRITPAAAVASAEAIEETCGIRPGIKWVNDLFLGKKKIAGILSEAVSDFETGTIQTVIIGIGINCRTSEFPDEIKETAGSLNAVHLQRSFLAASLRKHLLQRTAHLEDPETMELYRRDSIVLGKQIVYTMNNIPYAGIAKAINEEGNLIIEKEDGASQLLHSGEISIKDWQ